MVESDDWGKTKCDKFCLDLYCERAVGVAGEWGGVLWVGTARLAERFRLFRAAGEEGGIESEGERECFPPGEETGV